MNEIRKRFEEWATANFWGWGKGIKYSFSGETLADFFCQFDGYRLVREGEYEVDPTVSTHKQIESLRESIGLVDSVTNERITMLEGIVQELTSEVKRRLDALQAIYREIGGDGDGLGHYEHSIVIVDNQKDQDHSCDDTELIECAVCKKPLNRLSLWVTAEAEPRTLCEECHQIDP